MSQNANNRPKSLEHFNWPCFLVPFLWGPANGIWVTVLYYPAWIFIDDLIYAAYDEPSALPIVFAAIAVIAIFCITLFFARSSQGPSFMRAMDRGVSDESYRKRQIAWTVFGIIFDIAVIVLATYYNIVIRPTM